MSVWHHDLPCRYLSGVVCVSLGSRPAPSLSVWCSLCQSGATTSPVVRLVSYVPVWHHGRRCHCLSRFRLHVSVWDHGRTLLLSIWCRACQSGTTTDPVVLCPIPSVSKWDHYRPCCCPWRPVLSVSVRQPPLSLVHVVCLKVGPRPPRHCLSDVVCPRMGPRPRLSLSVLCCPYHCCLSHAICLKVGPRPSLSLSVWCCPYHSLVICPMQSVSKWDHDRPYHCPSGVVRIIPLLSVPCGLSQSGTTTASVVVCLVSSLSLPYCYLSHAICLKVGPRPPLSLSVWCCPCQTGTTTIPFVACATP